MTVNYTNAEKYLMSLDSHMSDVGIYDFEQLAIAITDEAFKSVGFGIELGRHPTTDIRTYTLHVGFNGKAYMEQYIGFTWLKPKKVNKKLKDK